MGSFLRLRRTPKLPVPQHETDIFFVDADGLFKKRAPDGAVTSVAGAGSLPSPTDEGDVLTVVEGEWAGEPPSGGSITKQATYTADAPGLGAGADGPFSWSKTAGDDLLDLSDPLTPTVVEAGTYVVTGTVFGFDNTADGYIEGALLVGPESVGTTTNAPYANGGGSVGIVGCAKLEAGDPIICNYQNGGTDTVELSMTATVVKIG